MKKHVCILVSEHPFLDARIFKKSARSLVKHGYQVTMIVPRKNGYLIDVDGTLFKDRFLDNEFTHEGVTIITYEQSRLQKQWKQFYHNLQKYNVPSRLDRLIELGIAQDADIYHAHEFYSLYAGIIIKRSQLVKGKHAKLIYDSHELEPDPLEKQATRIKKIKLEMLKLMLKEVDSVITVSQSIQRWFQSLDKKVPVEVIYNSPPLAAEYNPGQGKNRELVLVYEGFMNKKKGSFRKLMKIVEKCNQYFPLKVVIIGGNKTLEKNLQIPSHLKNKVIQVGWIDYTETYKAMKNADLGWVDLNANTSLNYRFAMPNKFFSYLNNGLPVLANQCQDMSDFIKKHQCGFSVPRREATADDYVSVLRYLYANRNEILKKSKKARNIMESVYSWEQMEKKLVSIYGQLSR